MTCRFVQGLRRYNGILRWMAFLSLAIPAAGLGAAQSIDILPDPELRGWTRIPIPPGTAVDTALQWHVDTAAGTLTCTCKGGHEWLRYDQPLNNYVLSLDWRFTPREASETRYNGGIGVSLSKYGELWVQAQTALLGGWLFGDNLVNGAIERFNLRADMPQNRVKPAGEWNHYEIRVQDGTVTLAVNGEVTSRSTNIALRRGYLGLEAERYEITFKNIRLQSLD